MRIAVLGQSGQVARALSALRDPRIGALETFGRPYFDLGAENPDLSALEAFKPTILINAAAYTAVDRAETEQDAAYALNATGPARIASWAQKRGLPFFHLSTDYVFPGDGARPYREEDPVGPLSVYGKSKLAGEEAIHQVHPGAYTFRTAWVYDAEGQNFVKTMLRLAGQREDVTIVSDQFGSPTYAPDLALALLEAAASLKTNADAVPPGIYHLAGRGDTSWAGFAEAIYAFARRHKLKGARVRPILTADYPTPAKRPANSRLDTGKFEGTFGTMLPPWYESLGACMAKIAIRAGSQ